MDKLPDDVLLAIFRKLYFSDLCRCAQVCNRWYAITQALILKKEIIVKNHLKHWQFSLLFKYHFHEHLEVFELLDTQESSLSSIKKKIFFQLRTKCPRLKRLVLMACSLANATLDDIPYSIQQLSVRNSEINPYLFFGYTPQIRVPHLTCLDVGGVSNFLTSEDLHIFTHLKSLRCLFLEGCFRINNAGIESITNIIENLEVLDVEGTDISDEGLMNIISYGYNLKKLYVGSVSIGDNFFQNANLNQLESLKILCLKNTGITSLTVNKIYLLENDVKVLSNFDSSGDNMDVSEKTALDPFFGCKHYFSHKCCS